MLGLAPSAAASCSVGTEPRARAQAPLECFTFSCALFQPCLSLCPFPVLLTHRFVPGQLCQPCSHPLHETHAQLPASAGDVLCQRCAILSARPLYTKQWLLLTSALVSGFQKDSCCCHPRQLTLTATGESHPSMVQLLLPAQAQLPWSWSSAHTDF